MSSDSALIVLAHGSRAPQAGVEFEQVVQSLRLRFPTHFVTPAYMELAEPDFPSAVRAALAAGARRVVVLPCFLFMGNHIQKDIPELIGEARAAHPQVEFIMARHLGPDPRIAEVVANRALEVLGAERLSGSEIEQKSMAIIEELLAAHKWNPLELAVVKRLVHTVGDPTIAAQVSFSPGAAQAGHDALSGGAPIITDVKMVAAGLTGAIQEKNPIHCAVEEADAASVPPGATRSESGMALLTGKLHGAIVAVGNAPTALRALIRLVTETGARPALVIGMPVGFVDAAESKEALVASGLPYIVVRGSRGGSPMAATTVNALTKAGEAS